MESIKCTFSWKEAMEHTHTGAIQLTQQGSTPLTPSHKLPPGYERAHERDEAKRTPPSTRQTRLVDTMHCCTTHRIHAKLCRKGNAPIHGRQKKLCTQKDTILIIITRRHPARLAVLGRRMSRHATSATPSLPKLHKTTNCTQKGAGDSLKPLQGMQFGKKTNCCVPL